MKLIRTTIGALLERNAQESGSREAVIFFKKGIRYTWKELDSEVSKVAKSLVALGIGRGSHVAVWATNVPEWYIIQLASARIGAVLVTINPEWKQRELSYAIRQSESKVLVMIPGFEKTVKDKTVEYDYVGMFNELCPDLPCSDVFPELKHVVLAAGAAPPNMLSWEDFLEKGKPVSDAALDVIAHAVEPDDAALLQYTSGTTGFPKGAMLSHYNVVNNARAVAGHMRLSKDDRLCGPVPFYHCFGSILVNLGCLVSKAAGVIPSAMFDAHQTLKAVEAEKCTVLYGVPTMFIAGLEDMDFDAFDLHTLRTGIMAGAPVDKELFEAVTQRMGAKEMTIAYGLTEASPVTHQTTILDPVEKRITTVGKPIEHTEARIVNPNTYETLDAGEVGEIWVKGFHVMDGYFKKPEETAKTIVEDGWLRSGDLGVMDESGFYRIVGRLKEMIIVGGHNVYPAEVEQSLHSLLEDKIEILQVVGLPHHRLQEVVGLAVKCLPGRSLTLKEVRQRCDGKLEWPKIPRHLKVMEDFAPVMTVTGKIQKFKLAELWRKELELDTVGV
jgi:fatty-acyl-CoA synthase